MNRRSAPKVRNGRVQKKNNHTYSLFAGADYHLPQIIRQRPGHGYRHVLSNADVYTFLQLLPDQDEVLEGISAIVLATADAETFGCIFPYGSEVLIHINAWPRDLWLPLSPFGYRQELYWLEKLGVPCEDRGSHYMCKFTEETARAHQLLATLLHEIGHQHDRITTKRKIECGRGEPYAFEYSKKYMDEIFDAYCRKFGL